MTSAPVERFRLPEAGEARVPPEARGLARDEVRLAVVTPKRTRHLLADALPELLHPGDLLVVNTSATLPAAVDLERRGCPATLHLSTQLDDGSWVVELRRGDGTGPDEGEPGEVLRLPGGVRLRLDAPHPAGQTRLWRAVPLPAADVVDYLGRARAADPLPVRRGCLAAGVAAERVRRPARQRRDGERRATADRAGTGPADDPGCPGGADRPGHGRVQPGVARAAAARAVHGSRCDGSPGQQHPGAGRRVVAVGTTVVRALESAAAGGRVHATTGWTSLVLGPHRPATW